MAKDIVAATKSGEARPARVQKPSCPLKIGRGTCPDKCNAKFPDCLLRKARVTPGPLFPPSRQP